MRIEDETLLVVSCLTAAVSNMRLYASDHPQVGRYLERAHDQLGKVLAVQPDVTFLIVDDAVVVDNQALTANTPHLAQFVQIMNQCAVERLTFSPEVTLEALVQLVGDLASRDQTVVRSTPGITLGKVKVQAERDTGRPETVLTPETRQQLDALAVFRQRSLDDLKELYGQIRTSREISPVGLGEMVSGFMQGMLRNVNPLKMLASLKTSDEYTFTHAINVCILTMAQAESLGISGQRLHDIGVAAAMHDAGKMFVSNDILNKPDKLTDEEWHHMRAHATQGAQYILRLEGIPKLAFLAALEHHIRYDGTGYPDLGRQWRPNIVSQMIAVADLFDAMRSRRPYKEPKPDRFIIKILQEESGSAFNPDLVQNFLRLVK